MLGQDCRRKYCRPRDQGQTAWGQQCFPFAGAFEAYSGQSNRFDVFSSVVAATKIAAVSVYKAVMVGFKRLQNIVNIYTSARKRNYSV